MNGSTAIVFVPLLALAMMTLYVVLVFACHYFMTLVECTAHGQRTIQWPEEMFTEWLGKPLRLGWIGGLYLLPAFLISAYIGKTAGSHYVSIALIALSFAMLFPIGAVSAFIANSSWMPFHYRTIPLMLSKPVVTLGFFVAAFASSLAGVGGLFLAMFSKEIGWGGAVAGGILAALAWFVYGCALGRLLFALTYVAPPPRKKRKRRVKEIVAPVVEAESEVPYWERPKPSWDLDRDDTPYAAHAAEVTTKAAMPDLVTPKESEMKLLEKEPVPPPSGNPFGMDAFAPLFQNETMRSVGILAIMLALQSGLVRMLIDLNPAK